MASNYPASQSYASNYAKPSALKSFLHKKSPSDGANLPSKPDTFVAYPQYDNNPSMPMLPHDHPHYRALGERQENQQKQPPLQPPISKEGRRPNTGDEASKPLHKKTLSSISLKSLARRDMEKPSKLKDKESKANKPKKTKSSTNLSNLLSRPKSSKSLRKQAAEDEAREQKDKENRNPDSRISSDASLRPPPIYAQFSSEYFTKQPLGGKFLEDEIDLYTPQQYSPGKQRNFYQGTGQGPTLGRRDDGSQRPRSTYLPSSFSLQDISRRISGGSSRNSGELMRRVSGTRKPSLDRKLTDTPMKSQKMSTTRGKRVLAAVSAFGGKSKESELESEPVLEDKNVDKEFEAMLDRRNIPEHQRGKMRSLAMTMKKDFVKQDWAEIAAAKNGRPGTHSSDSSADATANSQEVLEVKTKRARSRTFTLSRASSKEPPSQTKKQKPQGTLGRHSRTNSSESVSGGSKSFTASGSSVAQTLIAKAKGQLPDDFVSYLRKVQKPELVEVGRLHKLRLLLRNETVAWTDGFIGHGGMEEIVGLLHRTMEVEWRCACKTN
jgi:hypothetical protein